MGTYIKGWNPPASCADCLLGFALQVGCNRYQSGKMKTTQRPDDCPLVEVKEPHGRLIDEWETAIRLPIPMSMLESVPTVIESEK